MEIKLPLPKSKRSMKNTSLIEDSMQTLDSMPTQVAFVPIRKVKARKFTSLCSENSRFERLTGVVKYAPRKIAARNTMK